MNTCCANVHHRNGRSPFLIGLLIVLGLAGFAGRLAAQAAPPAEPSVDLVDADPIKCWWRTSASSVRVGEPFTVVLTCAVVENDMTKVVPDQSRLEPSVMQFPPFEVVGGSRSPDIFSSQRRFFQYQYQLRLI